MSHSQHNPAISICFGGCGLAGRGPLLFSLVSRGIELYVRGMSVCFSASYFLFLMIGKYTVQLNPYNRSRAFRDKQLKKKQKHRETQSSSSINRNKIQPSPVSRRSGLLNTPSHDMHRNKQTKEDDRGLKIQPNNWSPNAR